MLTHGHSSSSTPSYLLHMCLNDDKPCCAYFFQCRDYDRISNRSKSTQARSSQQCRKPPNNAVAMYIDGIDNECASESRATNAITILSKLTAREPFHLDSVAAYLDLSCNDIASDPLRAGKCFSFYEESPIDGFNAKCGGPMMTATTTSTGSRL